ncbi:hypothetical protein [Abditibacterium utsteinense]|uniref:hypothetical protein n=1 Tax=Abditibacterium utsteinense TaxID=1960156 RepID=UPI000F49CC89|nr:hypothetical protein [Abditibacterium utsteinense]
MIPRFGSEIDFFANPHGCFIRLIFVAQLAPRAIAVIAVSLVAEEFRNHNDEINGPACKLFFCFVERFQAELAGCQFILL